MKGGRNKIVMNGYGELTDDLIAPITVRGRLFSSFTSNNANLCLP
jgi:hypothetical protein